MKIRCRGWYSGRWGAGPRVVGKVGVLAVVFCAVRALRSAAAHGVRLGEGRWALGTIRRFTPCCRLLRINLLSTLTVAFVRPVVSIGLVAATPDCANNFCGGKITVSAFRAMLIGGLVLSLKALYCGENGVLPGHGAGGIVTSVGVTRVPFF